MTMSRAPDCERGVPGVPGEAVMMIAAAAAAERGADGALWERGHRRALEEHGLERRRVLQGHVIF